MKKLVVWAIVLILCFSISGCGNSNSGINSVVRSHNSKDDVIKFDDIEWMSERSYVEKKIKDILYDSGIKIENIEYYENEKLQDKSILEYLTNISGDGDNEIIGNLAGWDIKKITIRYVSNDIGKTQYASEFGIHIKIRLEDKEEAFNDIKDKINIKYKDNVEANIDDKYLSAEWKDNNGNNIYMGIAEFNGGELLLAYSCGDIEAYLEENKKLKDSKGL